MKILSRITNLPAPIDDTDGARLIDITSLGPAAAVDVQTFTADGTWYKPTDAQIVHVICVGGGGGGGSGRLGTSSSNRYGGGGGAGGGYTQGLFQASALGSTETVTVGVGGPGGAAQTSSGTNGNNGTAGTNTEFGDHLLAKGGNGGNGGSTASGTAGGATNYTVGNFPLIDQATAAGGNGGVTNGTASATQDRYLRPTGGGGGGGLNTSGTRGVGANGGQLNLIAMPVAVNGGTGGNPVDTAAGSGNSFSGLIGTGGGGGSSGNNTATQAGYDGGDGGLYGGGGGGGGGGTDTTASGKGGDGGNGICVVITYKSSNTNGAIEINAQTGTTYTLTMSDAQKLVTLTNASAVTVTVPPNSSEAFPIGTQIALASGPGAGSTVTISPGSGVTITSRDSAMDLPGAGAMAQLVKIGTDSWILTGDLIGV